MRLVERSMQLLQIPQNGSLALEHLFTVLCNNAPLGAGRLGIHRPTTNQLPNRSNKFEKEIIPNQIFYKLIQKSIPSTLASANPYLTHQPRRASSQPSKNPFSATSPLLQHLDQILALFQNSPFQPSSRYIIHTLSNRVRSPGHIKHINKSYYQGLNPAKMPNNKNTSKGNSQQDTIILCLLSHLLICLKGCRS
jgi:hypothetical protein